MQCLDARYQISCLRGRSFILAASQSTGEPWLLIAADSACQHIAHVSTRHRRAKQWDGGENATRSLLVQQLSPSPPSETWESVDSSPGSTNTGVSTRHGCRERIRGKESLPGRPALPGRSSCSGLREGKGRERGTETGARS
eukprot:3542417-Rhodomonas_salina.1